MIVSIHTSHESETLQGLLPETKEESTLRLKSRAVSMNLSLSSAMSPLEIENSNKNFNQITFMDVFPFHLVAGIDFL